MKEDNRCYRRAEDVCGPSKMYRIAFKKYQQGRSLFQREAYDACCLMLRASVEALLKHIFLASLGQYVRMDTLGMHFILAQLRRFNLMDYKEVKFFDAVYGYGNESAHGASVLGRKEARASLENATALFSSIFGKRLSKVDDRRIVNDLIPKKIYA